MPGTGRYARFAGRVLATSTRPFAAGRTRAAVLELFLALALLMALPAVASAVSVTEFPLPTGSTPGPPTPGPDGNVWFTVSGTNPGIDRITPAGAITNFPTGAGSEPVDVTLGGDGNLWAGDIGLHAIWKITPTGALSEYTASTGVATTVGSPEDLTLGPDGNVWFLDASNHAVGDITPAGAITEYPNPSPTSTLNALADGPGKTLWFTDQDPGAIGEINLNGPTPLITDFTTPAGSLPDDITLGTDGNMWFTDNDTPAVWRITPAGALSEYGVTDGLSPGADPDAITVGPNGNVWFDDQNSGDFGVGEVTPSGQITEFHSGLTDGIPDDLTFGIDGNLWVPQEAYSPTPATVDRITTAGAVTNYTQGVNPNGGADGDTIITGPDGNLWFNDGASPASIGKISLQLAPSVTTDPATAIGNASATVTATVDPLGSDTDVTFQYGTSPAFGNAVDTGMLLASGTSSDVSATLTGLTPGTAVYYRAVATSTSGSVDGATETFTTSGQVVPISTTTPITVTTPGTATPQPKPSPQPVTIKPLTATMHLSLGDQQLTLITPQPPKPYACFANTTVFTTKLSARTLRKGTKLRFVSAKLSLDHGKPQPAHRLPTSASFSLLGSKPGTHQLTIALTFSPPKQRKHQHKQTPLKHTWTVRFRVC